MIKTSFVDAEKALTINFKKKKTRRKFEKLKTFSFKYFNSFRFTI